MPIHHIPEFAAPAPGDMTTVTVKGQTIAITAQDVKVYAFDDTCTRKAGGEVEDGAVICPRHFAAFDIATGAVRTGPAQTTLRCYRAELADGALLVEVPQ